MGQSKAVVKISFRATVMGDSIKMEGNVNKFDMIKQLTSVLYLVTKWATAHYVAMISI